MRIIKESTLKKGYEKHSTAEPGLRAWKKLVKAQEWNSFADVKATSVFKPDQVKNFVVFNPHSAPQGAYSLKNICMEYIKTKKTENFLKLNEK